MTSRSKKNGLKEKKGDDIEDQPLNISMEKKVIMIGTISNNMSLITFCSQSHILHKLKFNFF